ncbi:MAG: (d)CMP kinase [Bacteroidaceae bacterium]|nr:(d)CMP kinase [Bacteroidaceae bacterium]
MSKIIVAIDGHSSCGKSTMAKALARAVGYIYVDTGAMYRCVTLYALRNRLIEQGRIYEFALLQHIRSGFIKISFQLDPETNLPLACLNGEVVEQEIRGMEVSNNVSPIAALPFVRTFLVAQQQAMGREKGIVMDGRDIATVVFPQAELKVFVTASAEVRAQRRFLELQEKGDTTTTFDEVLRNVQERDYIDSHREVAPLKPAEDSLILDNSNLTREQQNEWLLTQFHQRAD